MSTTQIDPRYLTPSGSVLSHPSQQPVKSHNLLAQLLGYNCIFILIQQLLTWVWLRGSRQSETEPPVLVCLSTQQSQLLRGRPSFISLRWAQLSSVLLDSKVTPFFIPLLWKSHLTFYFGLIVTASVKPWFPKGNPWASHQAWPGNLLERHIIYGPPPQTYWIKNCCSKPFRWSWCMLSSIIMALWHYNHLTTVNSWETKAFLLGTCSLGLYSLYLFQQNDLSPSVPSENAN